MSEWTREILTEFIEIYRKHNCLWQIKSKEYTNKNLKNRGYNELVNFCKTYFRTADRGFVTKKIQNMRAAFRKEANKVKQSKRTGTSSEDVYVPTLWYYDLLLFTMDQDAPVDSMSNIASPNSEFNNDTEEEYVDVDENSEVPMRENSIDLGSQINTPEVQAPTTSSGGVRSHKRKSSDNSAELRKFMNVCSTALTQKEQEVDEYMAIAINTAAKLKKMAPDQAYLSESLINQIITKGLFNELTRATVVTDQPASTINNISDYSRSASSSSSSINNMSDSYTEATRWCNL